MLPAYMANMAPIFVKNSFKFLAKPIDRGVKYHGKPLFGKNKTWRGLIFGTLYGIGTAYLQYRFPNSLVLINYDSWLIFGALMGFGAIFGDLIESYIKRRVGIKPGHRFVPWDQMDFTIGALLLSAYFIPGDIRLKVVLTLLIISPLLHILTNHVAFYLKLRNEKW
jgi:CDP-2,3-bis-(O-geranylgeranyl)-sn-glycerol synthase